MSCSKKTPILQVLYSIKANLVTSICLYTSSLGVCIHSHRLCLCRSLSLFLSLSPSSSWSFFFSLYFGAAAFQNSQLQPATSLSPAAIHNADSIPPLLLLNQPPTMAPI